MTSNEACKACFPCEETEAAAFAAPPPSMSAQSMPASSRAKQCDRCTTHPASCFGDNPELVLQQHDLFIPYIWLYKIMSDHSLCKDIQSPLTRRRKDCAMNPPVGKLDNAIGKPIGEIDTPALLIDVEALRHNIRTMHGLVAGT